MRQKLRIAALLALVMVLILVPKIKAWYSTDGYYAYLDAYTGFQQAYWQYYNYPDYSIDASNALTFSYYAQYYAAVATNSSTMWTAYAYAYWGYYYAYYDYLNTGSYNAGQAMVNLYYAQLYAYYAAAYGF
jgi:hypothetical protein